VSALTTILVSLWRTIQYLRACPTLLLGTLLPIAIRRRPASIDQTPVMLRLLTLLFHPNTALRIRLY
jgi:hypothetical protein